MSVETTYYDHSVVLGELATKPTMLLDDQSFVNFRALQKLDRTMNLFVTFRESESCIEDDENREEYEYDCWDELINTDCNESVLDQENGTDDLVDPLVRELDLCQRSNESTKKEMLETFRRCTKDISTRDLYGFDDVEPIFSSMTKHISSVENFDFSGEDDEIFVGRLFSNKEEFKIAMAIYAIKRVFRFKISRFAKDYIVMQCIDQKCDWRVYALQFRKSDRCEVRKAELKYTCSIESRGQFTKHATSKVVAALLRSKYGSRTNGLRARDLPEMVLAEHNVTVSYWKCWKAKELAISEALRIEENSYKMLPLYLHVLKLGNPGTICHLKKDVDASGIERFKYVFMSLGASIKGVQHLRKMVVMDGTHLIHGKYKGCLLSASGQNANFQNFPIAFVVVDSKNDILWSWFLEKLKDIVNDENDLVFVIDRQSSIHTKIESYYPLTHHGVCLVHLGRNITSKFKGKFLANLVTRAGEAFRVSAFKTLYEEIKIKDEECWEYLVKSGVIHCTRAYSLGIRYNLMSSNVGESINNALTPVRDSPIISLLEFIRRMISCWFNTQRNKAACLIDEITHEVDKLLIENLEA